MLRCAGNVEPTIGDIRLWPADMEYSQMDLAGYQSPGRELCMLHEFMWYAS